MRVTLTFDNGPTQEETGLVLESLDHAGVKAIFFVVGEQLRDLTAMEYVQRAHDLGHRIGAHTLTHSVALGDRLDRDYARSEIMEPFALLGSLADADRLFRPFARLGLIGPHLFSHVGLEILLTERCTTVLWNNIPGDWYNPLWVERCVEVAARQPWSVVVLHDIVGASPKRLPDLIGRLQDMGAEFRTDFPDEVVVTRAGGLVTLDPDFVRDGSAFHPDT